MPAQALAQQQSEFIALLRDDSQSLPAGWDPERFEIYRNAYRARLVDAVRETYPRTERWVGEDAFRRAAIHHVIRNPPKSWTLDAVGSEMPATLGALFPRDPEVSELAWLEWSMHECFVSDDREPLDVAGFQLATTAFGPHDWAELRLAFLPGTRVRPVSCRVDALWSTLGDDDVASCSTSVDYQVAEPLVCAVWRHGLTPVCATLAATEGSTLALMLDGANYGDACRGLARELGEDAAIHEAGAMLGRWIHNGMLCAIR